jgi:hypothetical protein
MERAPQMPLIQYTPLAAVEGDYSRIFVWSIALLLVLALGGVAVAWAARFKQKSQAPEEPVPVAGFTLSDLRQMHRAGQITDAEFAKAKEKVVEAAKKAAEKPPTPDGTIDRDSADAIRARRLAREAQQQQPEPEDDGNSESTS